MLYGNNRVAYRMVLAGIYFPFEILSCLHCAYVTVFFEQTSCKGNLPQYSKGGMP